MRIVFITNNYTPYSGGVVSSINATMSELQRVGHTVDVITLNFLGAKHNDPEHVHRITCPIKFKFNGNHIAVPWRPRKQILQLIQKLKTDIIHVHHPFLLGQAGLYAARKLHIPIIFTYHTLYEEYLHYLPLPQLLTKPLVTKTVLSFCNAVDGIIAPSGAVQEYLESKQVSTPIAKIPSGLQQMYINHEVKKNKKGTTFNLLFIGRFAKEKNISFLLDMFAQLQGNYSLTMVGYGPIFEQIKNYAFQKLKLDRTQVQFVHSPDKEQLPQLYAQADLFLFPSRTDTQGLVLAESMACGTPVVALDGPGQRDIIEQSKNGFIVQNQREMLAAIEKIKHDQQLQEALHKSAVHTAQQYDPKRLVDKLVSLYQKFIK